jgi:hypothetical protein
MPGRAVLKIEQPGAVISNSIHFSLSGRGVGYADVSIYRDDHLDAIHAVHTLALLAIGRS